MIHRPPVVERFARRARPGCRSARDVTIIAASIGPSPPARWRCRDGTGPIQPTLAATAGNHHAHGTGVREGEEPQERPVSDGVRHTGTRARMCLARAWRALLPDRSKSSSPRFTPGTRRGSLSANVARLSSAHARTNFCGWSTFRRRIWITRERSRGVHVRSGRTRTIWSRISHWSLSARRPMNSFLYGCTQSACSWAIFSRRSIARIDTNQSESSASEASSDTRPGVPCASASTCVDCAIDRRSPPESRRFSACRPRNDPLRGPEGIRVASRGGIGRQAQWRW
jgi:hypothetical protein